LSQENRAPRNRLLAALGEDEWAQLKASFKRVELPLGHVLYDAGEPFEQVYFPQTGVISTVAPFTAQPAEMATTGREGLVSISIALGADRAFSRHIVQVPGEALTIDIEDFRKAQQELPVLDELMRAYARAFLAQVMQSVACNAVHSVEARCARWLLMCLDRADGDRFLLTQEFLADMLGVSRASVNQVAQALQSRGLITYSRGGITVLDRKGLERTSCECYRRVRRLYDEILPRSFRRNGAGT
jgi:CRP-like cAMP-binding protein